MMICAATRSVLRSGPFLPLLALLVLFLPLAARAQEGVSLAALLEDALFARQPEAVRHEITLAGQPALGVGALSLVSMDYQPRTGAFSALVAVGDAAPARIAGRAVAMVEAPSLGRSVMAGETVSADDIVWTEMRADRLPADALTDPALIDGQEARRSLRPGVALRRYDLKEPSVIRKDDLIAVVYQRPGVLLQVRARALEDAARGKTMRVLNLQSNRTIEVVAEAPGRASVASPRAYADASRSISQ